MSSENIDPTVLKRGVLFAVDRDRAKSLFAARGDDALRDCIRDFAAAESIWSENSAIDCEGNWQAIDASLSAMEGKAQLDHCLLGGRPMYQGSEMTVTLVRPDLVPHLANLLAEVEDDALRESLPADVDFADLQATFVKIRELYRFAVEHRAAVVFAVEH